MTDGPPTPRRERVIVLAAVVAVLSAVGVWALWRVFVDTPEGQRVEAAALRGAEYGQTSLWRVAQNILDVVSVGFIVVVLIGVMVIAVARRRPSLAVQVALLMAGANLTTQLLKHQVFERPDFGVGYDYGNTLPSGHTTAAASASAALVLVVSPRVRPWAALVGVGYTVATGVSTLVGQWHRPSDVVAAVLVVLAWTAVTCVLVVLNPSRASTATGALPAVDGVAPVAPVEMRRVAVALVVAGALSGAVAVAALARTWTQQVAPAVLTREEALTAYLGGASGVLMASCLAFAVMLVLRQGAASRVPHAGGHP